MLLLNYFKPFSNLRCTHLFYILFVSCTKLNCTAVVFKINFKGPSKTAKFLCKYVQPLTFVLFTPHFHSLSYPYQYKPKFYNF